MGFFEPPDPRLIESADPAPVIVVVRTVKRHATALGLVCLAVTAGYVADVALGLHAAAPARGTVTVSQLLAPVTIVRDRRDIPHIRAHDDHDLYFAQGYVEGSDRLFQLDLTRRYAYGTLAEVLGPKAFALDKAQRAADINGIAARQLRAMAPHDRAAVVAFSEGVNAAARSQPLPVESRMLLYTPAPWTPKDSLAVSIVASLELADSWHDVFARDAVWRAHGAREYAARLPLSDARYDVTVSGQHDAGTARTAPVRPRRALGSNAWATGAVHALDGHALIANDPHLDVTIPGIWYLVDLQSSDVHVAGATIPGLPGVVLGHNERLAWATTNAAMATTSVFEAGHLQRSAWVTERFHIRFARDVNVAYYRTLREFSVPDENDPSRVALVRWPGYAQIRSTIATALALDGAGNVSDALRILAQYRGSPQNFILADRGGTVAYHVAGLIPDDPAWGRYVHRARELRNVYSPIPFGQLPQTPPSRTAVLLSANNKAYAPGYAYRLSAQFEPPYRAYRIAQLLHARSRYDPAYFAQMQLDTLSPVDLAIAHDVVGFARAHP
ncbi:MAG: penicillin acylase family protein, partial [Candidatus Cybelea sp.]